jgi:hypothetical protein
VIAIAWKRHWPLMVLLWPYWLQSVVIGWYNVRRVLALRQFRIDGIAGYDKGSDESTKRLTAFFFALHYGLYHLLYLFFLLPVMTDLQPAPLDLLFLAVAVVSFALTQRAAHARIVASDRTGSPYMGKLMFLPYLRVVPMHAAIIVGVAHGPTAGVILFGSLKTLADVLMQWVELRSTLPKVKSSA